MVLSTLVFLLLSSGIGIFSPFANGLVADLVKQFGSHQQVDTAAVAHSNVGNWRAAFEKPIGGGTETNTVAKQRAMFASPRQSVDGLARNWQAAANAKPLRHNWGAAAQQQQTTALGDGTPLKHKWQHQTGEVAASAKVPAAATGKQQPKWTVQKTPLARNANVPAATQPQREVHAPQSINDDSAASWDCSKFTENGRERCEKWRDIAEALRAGNRMEYYANCKGRPLGTAILRSQLVQVQSAMANGGDSLPPVPPITFEECHIRDERTWTQLLASVQEQLTVLPVPADKMPLAFVDNETGQSITFAALQALVERALANIQNDVQPPPLPKRKLDRELEMGRSNWLNVFDTLEDYSAAIGSGKFVAIKYAYGEQQADLAKLLQLAAHISANVIEEGKPVLIEAPARSSFKDNLARWQQFDNENAAE